MCERANTKQQDYGMLCILAKHKDMKNQDTYLLKSDQV